MKKALSLTSVLLLSACAFNPLNLLKTDAFKITNNNKSLLVTSKQNADSSSNSDLKVASFAPFEEYTFMFLPNYDALDNEATGHDYGQVTDYNGEARLAFFKYTFFIENTSEESASYKIKFSIRESKSGNSNESVLDTVRLMVFENDADTDHHDYAVYAKSSNQVHIDRDGNATTREFVASFSSNGREDDDYPLVTDSFQESGSNSVYIDINRTGLMQNMQLRYTMVVWLEGYDPDSSSTEQYPPSEGLKISVTIS